MLGSRPRQRGVDRLWPEAMALVGGYLLEVEREHVRQAVDRERANLVDGYDALELARCGRERRIVEPASGNPLGEGRGIEVDDQRLPLRGHPLVDVHPDRSDLPRVTRTLSVDPQAGQSLDRGRLDPERRQRGDQRELEVAAVLLHVLTVTGEVEDRVADELPRAVIGRLAAAVAVYDLDFRLFGNVELAGLGTPAERDDRRMLEQHHRIRNRTLRDGGGQRALQLPRLDVRDRLA